MVVDFCSACFGALKFSLFSCYAICYEIAQKAYENIVKGYYFVAVKDYFVFYRLEKETMLVNRVIFGKSDYMKILRLS
jgi:hypothetical protein